MTLDIPGYKPGTYVVDPVHSDVTFEVRHMMISKVRGAFDTKEATIVLPENPLGATVTATADVASIDTGEDGRDDHLRSEQFFDVEKFPTVAFASTGVREQGDGLAVDGDLTIRDVTKPVTFSVEIGGFGTDPWGGYRGGVTATTTVNREEFGLTWNAALEGGGMLVGKDVKITLDLEGVLQA